MARSIFNYPINSQRPRKSCHRIDVREIMVFAEAAQIGHNHVKTGSAERFDLRLPHFSGKRESVQQNDGFSASAFLKGSFHIFSLKNYVFGIRTTRTEHGA